MYPPAGEPPKRSALGAAGADAVAVWLGPADGAADRMAEFVTAVQA